MKHLIAMIVFVLSVAEYGVAAEESATKSVLIAKTLNLSVPFGGLGYKYLGVWDEEYGYKMMTTQGLLFTSGVSLLVVGDYQSSKSETESDIGLSVISPYSVVGFVFLAAWAGTQMWNVHKVDYICDFGINNVKCSF